MMKKIMPFLFICIPLVPAHADDLTIFGFPIAREISIPECAKTSYGYVVLTSQVCIERLSPHRDEGGPVVTETVLIHFPISEAPEIAKSLKMSGRIIDGKLEGVGFNTRGTEDANRVLAVLKEKFGEPDSIRPRVVRNRLGASFEAFDSEWKKQDVDILFESVRSSLDSGLVSIETTKRKDEKAKLLKELSKDRRPL
jgi:hypothetical protein